MIFGIVGLGYRDEGIQKLYIYQILLTVLFLDKSLDRYRGRENSFTDALGIVGFDSHNGSGLVKLGVKFMF